MADGLTIPRDDSVALMKTGGRARSLGVNAHDHSTPSVASLDRDWPPRQHDGVAQPPIETCQLARESHKGLNNEAVQDAVQESAFERY